MQLIYAAASPFARKVVVFASEAGLIDMINKVPTTVLPTQRNTVVDELNPLGKVPILLTAEGEAISDSVVICQYLDSLASRSLIGTGAERWSVMTAAAWADGLMEAALLLRYEQTLRLETQRSPEWIAGQRDKIERVLDCFETKLALQPPTIDLAHIALACALGYLDFRFAALEWRQDRPRLSDFLSGFAARPSMVESLPV